MLCFFFALSPHHITLSRFILMAFRARANEWWRFFFSSLISISILYLFPFILCFYFCMFICLLCVFFPLQLLTPLVWQPNLNAVGFVCNLVSAIRSWRVRKKKQQPLVIISSRHFNGILLCDLIISKVQTIIETGNYVKIGKSRISIGSDVTYLWCVWIMKPNSNN